MNRKSTSPIPEPILQLQRQLDQFSQYPAAADEAAGVAVGCGRTGPATRCVFRRAPAPAGLYGAEEAARRNAKRPTEGDQACIRGTDHAASGGAGGVRHRVRVLAWRQDAHPVEGIGAARLAARSLRRATLSGLIDSGVPSARGGRCGARATFLATEQNMAVWEIDRRLITQNLASIESIADDTKQLIYRGQSHTHGNGL